jgi:hypothetical protein
MTTGGSSPAMDEIGGDSRCRPPRPFTFWHQESGSSGAPGAHGTPNCCYEHANQNL